MQKIRNAKSNSPVSMTLNRLRSACIGLAWVTGLLAAGSDSPYMPWVNILGLLLFLGASLGLTRSLRRTRKSVTPKSGTSSRTGSIARASFPRVRQNRRMGIRPIPCN